MNTLDGRKLHFVSFGLGAVGTYIGGSLLIAGHHGIFIERPEVAEKIRNRGLSLDLKNGIQRIPNVEIVTSVEDALRKGPFDFALMAIKSYDLPTVIESIEPFKDRFPPVLCLQNGVENEGLLKDALGDESVIPGTLTSAVGRGVEGEIFLERLHGIGLSSDHVLVPKLLQAMGKAGLNPCYFKNADGMKWTKMMTNLVANASSAILNMTPGDIFSHPGLFRLEVEQLRECLRVMHKLNIPVINIPGVSSILFGAAVKYLPLSMSRPILYKAVGKARGLKMPSFHIDLYSGKGKSEVNFLNGAVARFGMRCNVATPINEGLNRILMAMTVGEIPISDYAGKPDRLLILLGQ